MKTQKKNQIIINGDVKGDVVCGEKSESAHTNENHEPEARKKKGKFNKQLMLSLKGRLDFKKQLQSGYFL